MSAGSWQRAAGALPRRFRSQHRTVFSAACVNTCAPRRVSKPPPSAESRWWRHPPPQPSLPSAAHCGPLDARQRLLSSSADSAAGVGGDEDDDATVQAIVACALAHVRMHGWSDEAVEVAVADLGLPSVAEVTRAPLCPHMQLRDASGADCVRAAASSSACDWPLSPCAHEATNFPLQMPKVRDLTHAHALFVLPLAPARCARCRGSRRSVCAAMQPPARDCGSRAARSTKRDGCHCCRGDRPRGHGVWRAARTSLESSICSMRTAHERVHSLTLSLSFSLPPPPAPPAELRIVAMMTRIGELDRR